MNVTKLTDQELAFIEGDELHPFYEQACDEIDRRNQASLPAEPEQNNLDEDWSCYDPADRFDNELLGYDPYEDKWDSPEEGSCYDPDDDYYHPLFEESLFREAYDIPRSFPDFVPIDELILNEKYNRKI